MEPEEPSDPTPRPELFDAVVNLCKRRGFVFPSAEIYGGIRSTYDYGPLGANMLRNVKDAWWRAMIQERDDVVAIDGAILTNPEVWIASGHVATFTDPLVDCRNCKERWRADQLQQVEATEDKIADWDKKGWTKNRRPAPGDLVAICENCGSPDLTEARAFNLMFETHVGPLKDEGSVAYLR